MQAAYHIKGNALHLTSEAPTDITADPRGLLHVWEEPKSHARYIVGCDPTFGQTGWNRAARREGDHKIDNCAIEVFRVDAIRAPELDDEGKPVYDERTKEPKWYYRDLQVAEFFAPVDPVEAARICNLVGRIYAGDAQDQAELIFEAFPGPGVLTLQELLRLGYGNLWHWETIAGDVAEQTNQIGWRSWRESQLLLWQRARRHLLQRRAKIQSAWLLAEYANAVLDPNTMRARAAYGVHDDLLQAANMCFWAGHKWTYDPERTWEEVAAAPDRDWQTKLPVMGEELGGVRGRWQDIVDSWAE